jgi:hypothetical protein
MHKNHIINPITNPLVVPMGGTAKIVTTATKAIVTTAVMAGLLHLVAQ